MIYTPEYRQDITRAVGKAVNVYHDRIYNTVVGDHLLIRLDVSPEVYRDALEKLHGTHLIDQTWRVSNCEMKEQWFKNHPAESKSVIAFINGVKQVAFSNITVQKEYEK